MNHQYPSSSFWRGPLHQPYSWRIDPPGRREYSTDTDTWSDPDGSHTLGRDGYYQNGPLPKVLYGGRRVRRTRGYSTRETYDTWGRYLKPDGQPDCGPEEDLGGFIGTYDNAPGFPSDISMQETDSNTIDLERAYDEPELEPEPKRTDLASNPTETQENIEEQRQELDDNMAESIKALRQCLQGLKSEREKIHHERMQFEKVHQTLNDMIQAWRLIKPGIRASQDDPHQGPSGLYFYQTGLSDPPRKFAKPGPSRFDKGKKAQRADHVSPEKVAFDEYNQRWMQEQLGGVRDACPIIIPWPTLTLQVQNLSDVPPELEQCFRRPELHAPLGSLLQQWNAFTFFVKACGLKPCEPLHHCGIGQAPSDYQCELIFDIQWQGLQDMAKLHRLKAILKEEKRRWHPDGHRKRWRWRPPGIIRLEESEDDCAKAVFNAVVAASDACRRVMKIAGVNLRGGFNA